MTEPTEITPGKYTDGTITWNRDPEKGTTTHPNTREHLHYGCGCAVLQSCNCLGHEGVTVELDGDRFCPDHWARHLAEVHHADFMELRQRGFIFGQPGDGGRHCPSCGLVLSIKPPGPPNPDPPRPDQI